MDRNIVFGTTGAERMRIDVSGNIGIGTNNPAALLHVVGSYMLHWGNYGSERVGNQPAANEHGMMIRPNAGNSGSIQFTEDAVADRWAIGIKAGEDAFVFSTGGSLTGGTEKARLTNAGNFGIGVAVPSYKLDVNGDINIATGQVIRVGGNRLISTPGTNNMIVGINAGLSNSGSENTFVGKDAGYSNTSGIDNTFAGFGSGQANTLGQKNTFLGRSTGALNTTGVHNTYACWCRCRWSGRHKKNDPC